MKEAELSLSERKIIEEEREKERKKILEELERNRLEHLEEDEHCLYSIEPPHYGNLYTDSLTLSQQMYKTYIDEKYKSRFVVSFKAEDDDAIKQLRKEIATDIFEKEKKNPNTETSLISGYQQGESEPEKVASLISAYQPSELELKLRSLKDSENPSEEMRKLYEEIANYMRKMSN
ncbi:MAG: hypothetical protein IKY01_05380 [Prevotella sp.]|nr:hypothetical protein [Prevotella sp.]